MPDRDLPFNIDAEQRLLSCLFFDSSQIHLCISNKLKTSDFYWQANQKIYDAIIATYHKGFNVDPATVSDELMNNWGLEMCGWLDWLFVLAWMEITADKTLDYLKIVIDRSKQRSFIKACNKAVSKAYDTFNENIISDLRVEMNKALNWDIVDWQWWKIWDVYDSFLKELESWWVKPICLTGIDSLDYYTKGFGETSIWVIWARSSTGKSTFVYNLLLNAIQQWVKCWLFSLEVSKEEVWAKVISNIWGIAGWNFSAWNLNEDVIARVKEIKSDIEAINDYLYVYDKIRRYDDIISQMYALAWQWVKLFAIDHILLIKGNGKSQSKAADVWEIVNGFKWLAQELWVCIILVSQFSRWIDKRYDWDKEPVMSDFAWSSDIENIANVALWLQRQEQVDKDMPVVDDRRGTMDCYIMKNRNGDCWHLVFKADMARCKITDMPNWEHPQDNIVINREIPKWKPATIDEVFADIEEEISECPF